MVYYIFLFVHFKYLSINEKEFPEAKPADLIKMYEQRYGTRKRNNKTPNVPGYPGSFAGKGKQVKRPIVPFYSGKMGV